MIRVLELSDYTSYSALRSHGLMSSPTSFWASEKEELPIRKARFEATLKDPFNFMIGYFIEDQLVSIAGFVREDKDKLNHKGFIWGVYTHPDHRGQGYGKNLMLALMEKAFLYQGLTQINLSTGALNTPAIRLYEKLGFKIYGTELKSSKVNGDFYDEVFMSKFKN